MRGPVIYPKAEGSQPHTSWPASGGVRHNRLILYEKILFHDLDMFTPTLKGYTENEKLYCLNFGLYTLVISIAAIAYGSAGTDSTPFRLRR